MKKADYVTPGSLFRNLKYISLPASEIPPEADFLLSIEGDGMEPVFHDGQQVFLQECDSLFPYDPGAFIVNGKLYLRLFTVRDGVPVLTTYEDRREPIVIGPETDFHIIGRALRPQQGRRR